MKFKKKKPQQKWWWYSVVVIIIATAFIHFDFFSTIGSKLFLPIKTKVYNTTNSIKGFYTSIAEIQNVVKVNKELEVTIEKQKHLAFDNLSLTKENKELRELLKLKKRARYHVTVARISYIDSLNPYETISIDKGSEDGLEINMAVTSTFGLIGRIKSVTEHSSEVELITANSSYISATDRDDETLSILSGQGNDVLDLEYIVKDKDVHVGDKIYTSGVSDIYKKNIFLGTIDTIDNSDEMFKQITVKLPYNIFNLKDVMVLRKER